MSIYLDVNANSGLIYRKQIATVAVFFFLFGFITWVNGALIPYLRLACELDELQSYFVTFAFYISYTLFALPSSYLIRWKGMVGCIKLGLYIMSFGCLLFIPAAYYREYILFLIGLFFIGAGLTILQTGINPFITLLGAPHKAAQRISIMSACNKFAGLLAPIVFTRLILGDNTELVHKIAEVGGADRTLLLDQLAREVIIPYAILALILVSIALLVRYTVLNTTKDDPKEIIEIKSESRSTTTYYFQLLAGFLAIFCCVGAEVVAGDTIANYGISQQMDWTFAKQLTSFTLGFMFVGCVLGAILIPRYIKQSVAFLISSLLGLLLVLIIIIIPAKASVYSVALLGLANAFLWPAIWPQALQGLSGKRLNVASSVLIMGIAGGAIMPLIYGFMVKTIGNQWGYIVLLPCYLYLLIYWYLGRKR